MEDGLRDDDDINSAFRSTGLNPCFSGRWSASRAESREQSEKEGS